MASNRGRSAALLIIIASLLISVVFSAVSFTGYVVADEVNNPANAAALVFLLGGLAGAYYLLRRKQ